MKEKRSMSQVISSNTNPATRAGTAYADVPFGLVQALISGDKGAIELAEKNGKRVDAPFSYRKSGNQLAFGAWITPANTESESITPTAGGASPTQSQKVTDRTVSPEQELPFRPTFKKAGGMFPKFLR